MDVEDLKSGKFGEALLAKIESATDFIVILTTGCLEWCKNEDDWLRQEIRHAIACKRNIVPVLARGFEMPSSDALLADIAELTKYNGLIPAHELFEASIDRLVATFLKASKSQCVGVPTGTATVPPRTQLREHETAEERFAQFFAERPTVLSEIEAEASRAPAEVVVEFERLLVRLEIHVCEPPPPSWISPEDQAHRQRLLALVELHDGACDEARAFVAVSRHCDEMYAEWYKRTSEEQRRSMDAMSQERQSGYREWRQHLDSYQRAIGDTANLRTRLCR